MNNNIKEMFDKLIGARIVQLSEDEIVVRDKDGETFDISFHTDDGDCCGYTDITKELFFEPNNKNNPIITNWDCFESEEEYGGCRVRMTLFGLKKPLAKYEFECNSGSGWCYGATITAVCGLDNKEVEICSW